MKPRLLDLFCGAGGCAKGYQRAGFYVVGVDINPQPRYCGEEFMQGDALEYCRQHGHEFDAIHASPPCQAYCSLKSMPNAKKHPDLVVPTREVLQASGLPHVIENVPGAPLIDPTVLCGTMFGLGTGDAELWRHRLFETNWSLMLPFGMHCKHYRHLSRRTICVVGQRGIAEWRAGRNEAKSISQREGRKMPRVISVLGAHGDPGLSMLRQRMRKDLGSDEKPYYFTAAERNEAMGIDWMKGGEISQAIPPAYTEFIGRQLMAAVAERVPHDPPPSPSATPVGDSGFNGISNEALLAVIIDRMRGFQSGEFKCRENAIALTHLEDAMHWLQHRTRHRVARGVEGTLKA